jgi:hypothetical protein
MLKMNRRVHNRSVWNVVLVLMCLVGALMPGQALAVSQVDQAQEGTFYGADDATGYILRAQVFRPNLTGMMDRVAAKMMLILYQDPATGQTAHPGDLIVQIRAVDPSGMPTDTILSSTLVPEGTFQTGDYFWYEVPLGQPLQVTAGTRYALVLSSTTVSSYNTGAYMWAITDYDPYPAGANFTRMGANTWTTYGQYDFQFRTYVDPNAQTLRLPPPARAAPQYSQTPP